MAFTQSDLDALDDAIKGSELSVRFSDGSSATYRSMDELIKARSLIKSELVSSSTTRMYPRYQTASFND